MIKFVIDNKEWFNYNEDGILLEKLDLERELMVLGDCFCQKDMIKSLENVEYWYNDIKKTIPKDIPVVVVGNKSDLVNDIQVFERDIKEMADKHKFHYILTSAKTGENVNDSFMYIAFKILESI